MEMTVFFIHAQTNKQGTNLSNSGNRETQPPWSCYGRNLMENLNLEIPELVD
jgi:hypothetical protein